MQRVPRPDRSATPGCESRVGLNGTCRRLAGATLAVGVFGAMVRPGVDFAGQSAPSDPSNLRIVFQGAAPVSFPSQDPSWVSIHPGTNIQTVVNRYPGATTFYLRAGVHRQQRVNPKTSNTYIGERGAVLDGEDITPYAFEATTALPQSVTIKNLEITRYASPSQAGALQGDNGFNWIVEGNSIHDNRYGGVRAGRGWRVRNNLIYRNGVIGISAYRADGVLVESNDVYENNWSQARERGVLAEAAGMKIMRSPNAVIRNNRVHHNFAKGIWVDYNNRPITLIEGNTVTDNSAAGIWAEISYNVIIRNNTSERNGSGGSSWLAGAGIQVTCSPNVEIYGNTVRDNANGITGMQSSGCAVTSGPHGPVRLENLNVHDNVVRMQVGRTGISQNTGESQIYTTWNNHFERNTYYLGPNATYFAWQGKNLNESQWRAAGNDTTATFIR
jgi:parallel beta-helix repeat protein